MDVLKRVPVREQDASERAHNFNEVCLGYSMEEAKAEAARIMDQARKEAQLEKKRAADDMKKEMVAIASAMAGKVVAASIDTTVQDSLIDETIKEMGDGTWLS